MPIATPRCIQKKSVVGGAVELLAPPYVRECVSEYYLSLQAAREHCKAIQEGFNEETKHLKQENER